MLIGIVMGAVIMLIGTVVGSILSDKRHEKEKDHAHRTQRTDLHAQRIDDTDKPRRVG